MKKQNDRQPNGTKSESHASKERPATASKQVRREAGGHSISADGDVELIRAQAYRLFELRGRQPGHALDDWLQAEREILHPSPWTVVSLSIVNNESNQHPRRSQM